MSSGTTGSTTMKTVATYFPTRSCPKNTYVYDHPSKLSINLSPSYNYEQSSADAKQLCVCQFLRYTPFYFLAEINNSEMSDVSGRLFFVGSFCVRCAMTVLKGYRLLLHVYAWCKIIPSQFPNDKCYRL